MMKLNQPFAMLLSNCKHPETLFINGCNWIASLFRKRLNCGQKPYPVYICHKENNLECSHWNHFLANWRINCMIQSSFNNFKFIIV